MKGLNLGVLLLCGLASWPVMGDHPVDRYGQSTLETWAGKVMSDAQLREEAAAEWSTLKDVRPDLTRYDHFFGRREGLGLKATGWFRTEKIAGRWWLVTPEGNRFFLQGCDGDDWSEWGYSTPLRTPDGQARPELMELPDAQEFPAAYAYRGKVNFLCANIQRKHGADFGRKGREVTERRMLKWGFNTMSKWSFGSYERHFPYIADAGLGNVRRLSNRWRWIDMYDPQFEARVDEAVRRQCEKHRDEPLLIAYAIENENGWHHSELPELLRLDASWAAKAALIDFLGQRHPDVASLLGRPGATRAELLADTASLKLARVPVAELRAFVLASSERYHRVLLAAYRRHDPNHLVMGAAHCPVQSSDWIEGAARHVDFIGINTYDIQGRWSNALDEIYRRCDKPFAVLEYSFVVEGRGYRRYSHGNTVTDENARGLAYRYFVEREAARPHCLGMGHFLMWDQPVTRRSLPGGENFTFGLLSQCDQPYERMLSHVMETNRRVFDIHDGKLPVFAGISPQQVLATSGAGELFAAFMPGRVGFEVTVDDINGPKFHDVPARIKCTGAAPREGVAEIGVLELPTGRRVVTARAFLWDAKLAARMEDHLLVESSADGVTFTPHAARFEQTWQKDAVREWRVVADGFAPEVRFVRLSFRTARSLPLWAWQVSHVKVE
ncbi:MAG: hypothetical protein ACI4WT_09945 [Oligosphaeraceae bacterium]